MVPSKSDGGSISLKSFYELDVTASRREEASTIPHSDIISFVSNGWKISGGHRTNYFEKEGVESRLHSLGK